MKRACFSFFHTSLLKSTCNPFMSVAHIRRKIGVCRKYCSSPPGTFLLVALHTRRRMGLQLIGEKVSIIVFVCHLEGASLEILCLYRHVKDQNDRQPDLQVSTCYHAFCLFVCLIIRSVCLFVCLFVCLSV